MFSVIYAIAAVRLAYKQVEDGVSAGHVGNVALALVGGVATFLNYDIVGGTRAQEVRLDEAHRIIFSMVIGRWALPFFDTSKSSVEVVLPSCWAIHWKVAPA